MAEKADQFRKRARECRDLAERALDQLDRKSLLEIADDLDAEADKIDAEPRECPKWVESGGQSDAAGRAAEPQASGSADILGQIMGAAGKFLGR